MVGAFKSWLALFNVNYCYVVDELCYLLFDVVLVVLVYVFCFVVMVVEVFLDILLLRVLF